ncbi:hypothetical protein Poli38472_009717 [Pythium oligandrum]|uniref:Protein kinase domain-containing protein n=1 Tax=Pythium oligandrum TaxID=41045 RepID=A0A8K1CFS1_PYTOL|nr:hypothetical protein Poli38472_009717 [Pythium oligandrum]|eukprot:TMW62224.1 hypothetical protein Poli38472_009717 [Pythium oligandrum]
MSTGNGQTITVCGNVFRLVETIGRGSYGTVHKAINLSSGAAVAVKLISKDKLRRPHERRSIEKEIETMRVAVERFENGHPHIVRLLCTKESQHHIYIVLEYCAGGDLADVMKASRGLSEEQARLYMSQLASGLQFLRSQSVVHRDLKPANLLLSSRNQANAKLKIADFGFARELQSESLAESVVGSPLYMAPELLEYKSYDAKADLWSVGIILYEMLVNDHPFLVVDKSHATNHLALRRNIQRYFERYHYIRLPEHIKVSPECEELLQGLLRIDPRQRISFEDFFQAPFLLPPVPTEAPTDAELTNGNGQALVDEKREYEDWAAFSDEYVIVDKEYEDVGRRVLNQDDLRATRVAEKEKEKEKAAVVKKEKLVDDVDKTTQQIADLAVAPLPPAISTENEKKHDRVASTSPPKPRFQPTIQTESVDIVDMVVDTSTPRANGHKASPKAEYTPPADTAVMTEAKSDWGVTDDNRLEELLGICYKGFECGSVALFVPTPFGDYIAFHEGCPHYYLSMESIEAFKHDGRNPPYVLGCIVFIEDYVASNEGNPYCLREGTEYHIAMVTPLASSASRVANGTATEKYGDLPLSQALAPRTISLDAPPSPPPKQTGGFFSSLSSYLGHPTPPTSSSSLSPPSPPPPATITSPLSTPQTFQHQRISFHAFQISHLALFFLKGGKLPYVAFNEGAPNYYLASESIQAARAGDDDDKAYPAYILGEIIFIDTFQATEDFNPYRLPYGTRFYVVTVANPKRT